MSAAGACEHGARGFVFGRPGGGDLGTGVKMAAARAFISGVGLLSRPAFPHVIFPTVLAAAEWESERLEEGASRSIAPATLVAAANELTSALDAGRTMSSKNV